MSTTSGRKIWGAEANASPEQLQYTSEVGELFAKHNVANDNPNDITNQGKCKKGEKDNFVYVNQDYDGDNDEINFESAFNLGRFVLASPDDFAKLATQVPQQLTNILQQLSEAGCRRAKAAKKVLIKIGDNTNTPKDKKLSSSTTAASSSTKKKKEKKSPSASGTKKTSSTSFGHGNGSKKRKISGDTKQSPAVTTPINSGGKGDIKSTAVAAVTDVDKSGDTGNSNPTPKPQGQGTFPKLPLGGSGDGDGVGLAAAVPQVGGNKLTPQLTKFDLPKSNKDAAADEGVSKEGTTGASSGGVAASGGGNVAESGGDAGDVGSGVGGGGEEKAVDTALLVDKGGNSPRSQRDSLKQANLGKNAAELKKDREEYNQGKEVFRYLTEIDLKSGKDHKKKIAHTSVNSIQAGVDSFNAKASIHHNPEGDYARLAVEVGYNYFYSGPLDPSSVEQAREVLDNFTPLVEQHWKYFEEGRKLQPLGKKVDGKAFEDAASE